MFPDNPLAPDEPHRSSELLPIAKLENRRSFANILSSSTSKIRMFFTMRMGYTLGVLIFIASQDNGN
ncbi:hypothetical protein N7491_004946 [Penicillium cf. griseofulvum]|uniref:Uncharacterized protein n=1 Tax=Penicillium cf. griseofulvum TaxID=2972120 RepID=A0A9W9J6N1_9EURO|nr:hypothetical protein N7472_007640 [Penicillium cf. griseofulvum]KAJ5434351.1 hypothetical protein N7491_004946 [Penicillium cf. griseofulvum]KAJ5452182.1 hypothetical protein N7445_000365 [Penicillium cf. griseofulvum]